MDNATWQWVATGFATLCLALIGIIISFMRSESNRQGNQIQELWKAYDGVAARIGQTETRLSYIKGALANCKEIEFNGGDW